MNFILICLDTYRADCVRARGRNDVIQSPNLDAFARQAVTFDNAFGEGQPTLQFRQALITGMRTFPWKHQFDTRGLWLNSMAWHKVDPACDTLAEILQRNGYTTGFFADTYHMFKPTQNYHRGFTSWEFIRGQESDNWRLGRIDDVEWEKYTPPGTEKSADAHRLIQYLLNSRDRKREEDWTSAKTFLAAIRFLEDAQHNRPFFLWVDCFDPHEPWDPPKKYADLYCPGWNRPWDPIAGFGAIDPADEEARARCRANFYGECTFVDKWVGALLDKVDALGLTDETLVVVCSDHGTELYEHGVAGKGLNCRHRNNSEILLMMRLPGREHAGRRVEGFVQNHDVLPTALDVLGVEHKPVDGENLSPLITGQTDSVRDTLVTGWSRNASVRTRQWSWSANWQDPEPDQFLFDQVNDPGEHKNVAADRPDVCADYRKTLEHFLGQSLPATLKGRGPTATIGPRQLWLQKHALGRRWIEA